MAQNLLFAVVPETERRRIEPYCERVELSARSILCVPDEPPPFAYFPVSGVCSSLVHAQNGEAVEVGLIGREGMVGIALVLGEATNAFEIMVQVPGTALRIERSVFVSQVLRTGHTFCDALLKYTNLYLATVAQTAVCNRVHRIEQRLARWLLEMYDRADTSELPMTHELLGLMLGAYRPSITNALKSLQERGVLRVGRAKVTITDPNLLQSGACECHQTIRRRTAATLKDIRNMAA